nr:MAG TPA: hypothetical protein [Caudoviricetes sp.]
MKSYPGLTRAGNVDRMCRRAILAKIKAYRRYYISVERDKEAIKGIAPNRPERSLLWLTRISP